MNAIFWNDCPGQETNRTAVIYRYIGPYKVADWIRQHGYTAQVIDFVTYFTEEELWDFTTKFITDETVVLGISTTFLSQHVYQTHLGNQRLPDHILKVMLRIKEAYPKIKIILGGQFAESLGTWKILDGAVIGAGEDIFLELIEHYIKGSPPPKYIVKIPHWGKGVVAQYYETNNKKYNIEVDSFKFQKNDCIVHGETLPLEISRGCIFKCKFCQYENLGRGKLDYLRSIKCVEEELLHNYENFGVTNYQILCDTFNDTTYKVNEWYKMTQRLPFKINFTAYIRADLLYRYKEECYQLKESGLMGAFHGIETLTPGPAKLVGKGWSGTHAKEWLPTLYHDIWNKEVAQHFSMIVGFPDDPKENVKSWQDWFISNKLHSIKFTGLVMHRDPWRNSSEFEKNAEKYGFVFTGAREWKNNTWNYEDADKFAIHMDQTTSYYRKFGNWTSLSMLTYGYDKKYILETLERNWDRNLLIQRKAEFLSKYKKLLREI